MLRKCLVFFASVVLAGCATQPSKTQFENNKEYSTSFDSVWTQVVGFFATNNIPIKNIAKDSGVIYAEAAAFDAGDADCGSIPLMVPEQNIVALNVFVQDEGNRRRVSINATFHQTLRGLENAHTTVTCLSRGRIEQTILDSIH